MGVNLQKAAQKTFEKHTDRAIAEVSGGDLFNQVPAACPRRFFAEPVGQQALYEGDCVALELQDATLVGSQGAPKVLDLPSAPADIVDHVRQCGGLAYARVVAVNPFRKPLRWSCARQPTSDPHGKCESRSRP